MVSQLLPMVGMQQVMLQAQPMRLASNYQGYRSRSETGKTLTLPKSATQTLPSVDLGSVLPSDRGLVSAQE